MKQAADGLFYAGHACVEKEGWYHGSFPLHQLITRMANAIDNKLNKPFRMVVSSGGKPGELKMLVGKIAHWISKAAMGNRTM